MAKKRVESIDAFRGFTIFAMIFVIQVAGFRNLPQTFSQFGSAPVSTWKHAGEDGEAHEWAFYEGKTTATLTLPGKIIKSGDNGLYDVEVALPDGNKEISNGVSIWTPIPLGEGREVIAKRKSAGDKLAFQAVGIGCTFTDLVAPFFVFIVGVCIPLSRQSRGPDWWKHALSRTLLLILAGIIYISLILKLSYWWGILQAIGIAYFMGAAFIQIPAAGRWVALAAVCAIQVACVRLFPWWTALGNPEAKFLTLANPGGDPWRPLTVHCTPWGSISYGICTIFGTFIGEAITSRTQSKIVRQCLIVGLIGVVVGYALHCLGVPMHKDWVTASYTIFTSGVGGFTFLLFYWLIDVQGISLWAKPLNIFGANALLAYFMQPIVRIFSTALGTQPYFNSALGTMPPFDHWGVVGGVAWVGMAQGLAWTLLLMFVVWVCNRRNIYWKL
ncbi:MAG: heparan-alpha-glucosaminide N-acetyltransferase domain-containing protein [Candidatus Sumerlaeaceae bacterium]|nr:heparan-alpha-glucosaminide N-acetyltransferase domain-containing protein [Candidatus Sumerlaeaceae bacterium]